MLANFFGKSKPVNFLVIFTLFLCYYLTTLIHGLQDFESFLSFLKSQSKILFFFLILFSVYNFIIAKNELTFDNTYAFLFFVVLIGFFPDSIIINKVFYLNLTLLLFLRKTYSLQSSKLVVKKLFDSGFWLGISFLIEPFSIIFAVLLYTSVYLHKKMILQNLLIPILGILTPIFLHFTYCFWYDKTDDFNQLFYWFTSYDFSIYQQTKYMLPIILVSFFVVISLLIKTPKTLSINNTFKRSWILLLLNLVIATCLIFLSKNRSGSELVYAFFPISVILTNGIETFQRKWLKEAVIILFLLLSFMVNLFIA